MLQVDYYKTCKTFYSKKKQEWGEGGGGQNKWKRRTMSSYISTLILFLKPQQSRGNKITIVAREGGGVSN
jgi:hypothetical protein